MKRIFPVVLALLLICSMAVTAMAAGITLQPSKDMIEIGEEITVTITLDETIPADAGAISAESILTYDDTLFTYMDAKASDAYAALPMAAVVSIANAPQIKYFYIDFSLWMDTIGNELPAGEVFTATFVAKEEMTEEAAEAAFSAYFHAMNKNEQYIVKYEDAVTVTVTPPPPCAHSYESIHHDATCTADAYTVYTCQLCGDTYTEVEENSKLPHNFVGGACEDCGMPAHALGDVNGDGNINISDAILTAAYFNERVEFTEDQLLAADVNGDGDVNISDAILIAAYFNERIDVFPAQQ